MFILTKASKPGWTKKFETRYEAALELRRHICGDCLDELSVDIPGVTVMEVTNADDLLATDCGCEFELEED